MLKLDASTKHLCLKLPDRQHRYVRACIFRARRASGTAAPEESTTVPLIEPDNCASRLRADKADARKREMSENTLRYL